MYIYGITEPNEMKHIYIGFTTKTLEARLRVHIYHSKIRKTYIANWIRKIVSNGLYPRIFLIKETNKDNWQTDERNEILKYRSSNLICLNISDGGESPMLNKKHSEATLKAMSLSHLGNKSNTGKQLPSKTREKISKSLMGNTRTLGIKHNDEFKEKCRKRMTENSPNALSIDKINEIRGLLDKNIPVSKVALVTRASETSIYRIKNNKYRKE